MCIITSIRRDILPTISSKSPTPSAPFATKVQTWSPRSAIDNMDQAGVATAINSMTSPGVWFEDGDAARARARVCNEYGAQMMRDFPGRFGMFAAIPLPDIDGSLKEIEYALDVLKLDGIGLMTSYAGKLLGDPAFAPVFEEINRRKAVVFVHPTMSCCGNPMPDVSPPTIEFPMDTTQDHHQLALQRRLRAPCRHSLHFSHGGGMLLPIVQRLYGAAAQMKPEDRAIKIPKGPEYELTRQYYELASIGFNPAGIAGLAKAHSQLAASLWLRRAVSFHAANDQCAAKARVLVRRDRRRPARQCAAAVSAAADVTYNQ